jgi:hypothetical protein
MLKESVLKGGGNRKELQCLEQFLQGTIQLPSCEEGHSFLLYYVQNIGCLLALEFWLNQILAIGI